MKKICFPLIFIVLFGTYIFAQTTDISEPVKYIGKNNTSNSDYITGYHDGQLQPAVGVQNYQILRANRSYPDKSDGLGWTYNHAPNLAYWNNRFYCHYLSNPVGEHIPPGVTLLTESFDGKHWDKPRVLFPIYFTADSLANIEYHFMHQRMGFYVAPDGRLLTMGFYGDPYGNGIGRVVREIYKNNELGPIYFIKLNEKWQGGIKYPFYTESPDNGFVTACEAFLNDKVRRMQWWEENRYTPNADDFFRVPQIEHDGEKEPGQAFCFYTLPDSTIVGFFKSRWVTVSKDKGETWTKPVQCESLTYGGAKIWGQRLDNGRYALVYNPTNSMARNPLSVATSDDGIHFDQLLNVHGEVPPKRFWGAEKRPGPQYVRGIAEGNGNPPGDDLWVVYSVSKEDIWISRIPMPVTGTVNSPVDDDFDQMEPGGVVENWNIYSPQWCPVELVKSPDSSENVLMLKDFDPYDYAKAVRVFHKTESNTLEFQLYIKSNPEILGIEVVAADGARCIQTQLDTDAGLRIQNGTDSFLQVARLERDKWVSMTLSYDSGKSTFLVKMDGKTIAKDIQFAEPGVPERIIFRTGRYRLNDELQKFKSGSKNIPGWDEPGADETVPEAVFYLKNFKAQH